MVTVCSWFHFTLCKSQQAFSLPVMIPQSGSRFKLCCFTMPCRTSCAGVAGWNTAEKGLHSEPCSLTTTIRLQSDTALSTNTYLPGSMNTCANLMRLRESDVDFGKSCMASESSMFIPGGVELCVFDEMLQTSEGTKVPTRVTAEQMIFLVQWEVAKLAVYMNI